MGGSNGSFATAPDQVIQKNSLPARFWLFSQKNLLAIAFVLLAGLSTAVIGYLKTDALLSWLYTGDLFSFDTVLQETLRGHIGLEFTYCNTFGDHAYFFLLPLAPLKYVLSSKMLYLLVLLGPFVYLGSSLIFFFGIKQIARPWKAFLIALVFLLGFGQTYPGLYEKLYGMHPDTFAGYLLSALAALLLWKEANETRGKDSRPQTAGAVILLLVFLLLKEEMALLAILFFIVALIFKRSAFHRNMVLLSAGVFGVDLIVMTLARTPFNRTNNQIMDVFIKNILGSGLNFYFHNPEVEPKDLQTFWLAIGLGCLLFCAAAVLSRRVNPYSLGLLLAGLVKMAFGTTLADFSLITWHNFPGLVMITAAFLIQCLFVVKIKSPYQGIALALLAGGSLFCFLSGDAPFTREHLIDQTQRKIEMSGYHKELSQFINQVNLTQVMSIPEFTAKRFVGYRYVFYPRGVSELPAGIADFVIYPLGRAQGLKHGFIQETPPPELLKSFSEVARTEHFILFKRTLLSESEKATRAACLPYSAP